MARMLPVFMKASGSNVTVISPDNYHFSGNIDILHPIDFVADLENLPAGDTIYTCSIHEEDSRDILDAARKHRYEVTVEK